MKTLIYLLAASALTLNVYSQWIENTGIPPGAGITDLVISGSNIVVTTGSFNYPSGQLGGMRYSSNEGSTWTANFNCLVGRTLAEGQSGNVFASAWNFPAETEALYKSTNNGVTWLSALYYAGSNNNIFSILVNNNNQNVFIGTRNGVHKSTNGGTVFTPVNTGIPANSWVRDLDADSTGNLGLFISTNNGTSWAQVTGIIPTDTIVKLQFFYDITNSSSMHGQLLSGSDDGRLYRSLELSTYLTAVFVAAFGDDEISDMAIEYLEEKNMEVISLATYPRNAQSTGFSLSIDNGTTWKTHNILLPPNPRISAITSRFSTRDNSSVDNVRYHAAFFENTNNGCRTFRFDSPIGIIPVSNQIPDRFSLSQNYPNPFNPNTVIKFQVTSLSDVKIAVFDILGREVATLVNEQLQPGTYEVDWDGSNFSSGVYYYKLSAGDFVETKKMVLIK